MLKNSMQWKPGTSKKKKKKHLKASQLSIRGKTIKYCNIVEIGQKISLQILKMHQTQ